MSSSQEYKYVAVDDKFNSDEKLLPQYTYVSEREPDNTVFLSSSLFCVFESQNKELDKIVENISTILKNNDDPFFDYGIQLVNSKIYLRLNKKSILTDNPSNWITIIQNICNKTIDQEDVLINILNDIIKNNQTIKIKSFDKQNKGQKDTTKLLATNVYSELFGYIKVHSNNINIDFINTDTDQEDPVVEENSVMSKFFRIPKFLFEFKRRKSKKKRSQKLKRRSRKLKRPQTTPKTKRRSRKLKRPQTTAKPKRRSR